MAGNLTPMRGKRTGGLLASSEPLDTEAVSSPPSGNSSDTLHDNDNFDDGRKHSSVSPLSTITLDFDDLTIHNEVSPYLEKGVNHISSPLHRNLKHTIEPGLAQRHYMHPFRRGNFQSGPGNGYQHKAGNYHDSPIRISGESRAAQDFLIVRNSMKRLFKNADVAKWKVVDYVAHREAILATKARKLAHQTQDNRDAFVLRVASISPQQQDIMRRYGLFGNFDEIGNYSRILGEKTIWCKDWQNGKEEVAPWPCMAELKWEGDDRAKTGVGRYPPLPREQGPKGLPWNQLQVVEQFPLDQIARIPTMEDVYLPVDEIDEEVKYNLLNKDLEDAMDAYLES
ncbi:hypothetical protein N0V94_003076 [Neodidymelliopsis sp. IMI 364377]|nr:hypothetical protein N0V94_003076 [Neodidymelliopsis sp. IMI 364377]